MRADLPTVTLGAIGGMGLMAALGIWLGGGEEHGAAAMPAAAAQRFTLPSPPSRLPAFSAYSAITSHPLFDPSRQSSTTDGSGAVPVLGDLSAFRLVGIALAGDAQVALVVRNGSTDTSILRIGDIIDGWVVDGIDAGGVSLSAGTAHSRLSMAGSSQTPR